MRIRFLIAFLAVVILPAASLAQEDRTLSPYFLVLSDDPSVDQLPLKSTRADVRIAGVIAQVEVTQAEDAGACHPGDCTGTIGRQGGQAAA